MEATRFSVMGLSRALDDAQQRLGLHPVNANKASLPGVTTKNASRHCQSHSQSRTAALDGTPGGRKRVAFASSRGLRLL